MVARAPGELISGRYRLTEKIGAGGMGSVWKACDLKLERNVAVKLVATRARRDADVVQRFVQEATLIAKIKSPHVVEIHDFGFDDLYPFLVMELLEGQALSKRLGRGKVMPLETVQTWATQLGKALASAHALGVVHRDLKPANVFLVPDGDDELLKVFDFGIARALDQARITKQLGGEEGILGTPGFMSPEQLHGEDVDARSDLWAFGVILYRALTGRMPFAGDSMSDVVFGILRTDPVAPTKVVSSLPPQLDPFIARALAKDRTARFQSARELVGEFRAVGAAATWSQSGRGVARPSDPGASGATGLAMVRSGWPASVPSFPPPSMPQADGRGAHSSRGVVGAVTGAVLVALLVGSALVYLAFGGSRAEQGATGVEPASSPAESGAGTAGAPALAADDATDAAGAGPGDPPRGPGAEAAASGADASSSAVPSAAPRATRAARHPPPAPSSTGTAASPSDLFSNPW